MSSDLYPSLLDARSFDLLPDPVFAWDAERRILAWNAAAEKLYGYSAEEALGRRPSELLRTRFPMPLLEVIECLTDTGSWEGELVQHTKSGSVVTVESRCVLLRDEQGELTLGLSVERDVTARVADLSEREQLGASAERVRLEEQLRNVQRLESVGQLAGGVAHDFNNLLGVIINYAALIAGELKTLERSSPDEERWASMRSDLGEIELAADRAARLTHHLLTFSRQSEGNPTEVDLNESVRSVEHLLRRTLGEHIELEIALAEDLRLIVADPGQIDHVLVNLAVNSRDAMPDGGSLTIDTANVDVDREYALQRPELLPGTYVRLRVSDTGVGMAPEVVDRAFDPFFTTKPLGEGTGLGLATVFGIVRQARGRAKFYSEPGVGTTFIALFPAAAPPVVAPVAQRRASDGPRAQTILLVEDEDALRESTRRILSMGGHTILAAANGADALRLAAEHGEPIDLLLTDVVMPVMLGHQLAAAMRRMQPSVRVLYMSGFAGTVLGQAMSIEGADLIEKPFTAARLLERVALPEASEE